MKGTISDVPAKRDGRDQDRAVGPEQRCEQRRADEWDGGKRDRHRLQGTGAKIPPEHPANQAESYDVDQSQPEDEHQHQGSVIE